MPNTSTNAPIIIIGSGMAGYSLAREFRKLNADTPVTLICRDNGDNYAKPMLSNAFAQAKLADTLANATAESMAQSLNITVRNFCEVSDIDPTAKTVTFHAIKDNKSQVLSYDKLVLATGASSRLLPNVTVDNQRIFAVNHLAEYQQFQHTIKNLLNDKASVKVAIIGAGLIGCEFANDLASQNGVQISVFDTAKLPLANQLPPQAGQALQTALQNAGVHFELGVSIDTVLANENGVTLTVKNSDGETNDYLADIVLVAIGLVANTALAEKAGLKVAHLADTFADNTHLPRTAKQGILVDECLQTSDPNIFAMGDCANVAGSFMPYVMPLMNQAKALAKTLANPTEPPSKVSYPAMPVAIKTPSLPLVVLPVAGQFSPEQINWQTTPTADGMAMTAFAKDDSEKLLGFVLVGKEAGKQRMALAKLVKDWI